MCNMKNIDHIRWSKRYLLIRGDHIKKFFFGFHKKVNLTKFFTDLETLFDYST